MVSNRSLPHPLVQAPSESATCSRARLPHTMLFAEKAQRTRFRTMMHQQFWLWGCDVRRPEGNLLLQHGFAKQRPPDNASSATSRYLGRVAGGMEIALWGFGLFATRPGVSSVFLPRLSLSPRGGVGTVELDGRWDPDGFLDLPRPQTVGDHCELRLLLADAFSWIREYERAVIGAAGYEYRAASIAAWKRPIGSATDLSIHWGTLATSLRSEVDRYRTTM